MWKIIKIILPERVEKLESTNNGYVDIAFDEVTSIFFEFFCKKYIKKYLISK